MTLMAQRMRRIFALTLIVAPAFIMLGSPLRADETTTTTSTTTTAPTTTPASVQRTAPIVDAAATTGYGGKPAPVQPPHPEID